MVNLVKIIATAVVGVGVLGALYGGLYAAQNHRVNREGTTRTGTNFIERVDWDLGSTYFSRWVGENQILENASKETIFSRTNCADGGGWGPYDGKVDVIMQGNSFFSRDSHYSQFTDKFDDCDEFLAKTKERFKDDINQ